MQSSRNLVILDIHMNMYEHISNVCLTFVLVEECEDVKQVMSMVSSVKEDKKSEEGVYLTLIFYPHHIPCLL